MSEESYRQRQAAFGGQGPRARDQGDADDGGADHKTRAEHTPGPWRWHRVMSGARTAALLLETERRPVPLNDPCILAVREDWHGYLRTPQGKANAALIAAAPALLEALEDLLEQHDEPRAAQTAARAAIAAARGEAPR